MKLYYYLTLLFFSVTCFADRPNVLFIAVDDLNDWGTYQKNPDAITPNIDQLAQQSTTFTSAQCQYPVCGPSRAAVMSGMFFHSLKLPKTQAKDRDVAKAAKKLGSSLMHHYFKEHGYKTMAVGKILHRHIDSDSVDVSGGRESWDTYRDEKGDRLKINFKSQKTLTDWDIYKGKEEDLSDTKAANWAVSRLQEQHDKPFMLMVGFLHPHVPWYAPKKYFDLYNKESLTLPNYTEQDFDDIPQAGQDLLNVGYPRTDEAIKGGYLRDILHAYLANISYVDHQIGRVLKALEKSEYAENTIVILWSDHGYHMGEKNTFQKDTLWNRSTQAPLMIKAPNLTKGDLCHKNVSLIDIYPTLLELCGLPMNDKLLGRSLEPLLKDPTQSWDLPAYTFLKDGSRSVHFRRWHLIEYQDQSLELYNLKEDPHELNNLALNPEYKGTLNMMRGLFNDQHQANLN